MNDTFFQISQFMCFPSDLITRRMQEDSCDGLFLSDGQTSENSKEGKLCRWYVVQMIASLYWYNL